MPFAVKAILFVVTFWQVETQAEKQGVEVTHPSPSHFEQAIRK